MIERTKKRLVLGLFTFPLSMMVSAWLFGQLDGGDFAGLLIGAAVNDLLWFDDEHWGLW